MSNIGQCLESGIINQLVVMATGLGKTHIASQVPRLIQHWKNGRTRGRLLFLVHRDELALQAANTFSILNPTLRVGIEKANDRAGDADIVIGSVQTLGKATAEVSDGDVGYTYGDRLRQFDPGHFDCVVVDECHHSTARTYQNVLRYFRALKGEESRDPEVLSLGITATPSRSDNVGLEKLYDSIVYSYGIREGVTDGWLAPIHAHRVETTVDISKVKISAGDFQIGDLQNAINTPERNQLVVREFLKLRESEGTIQAGTKPYAVVVDFADLSGRHSLVSTPTLFGLRDTFDGKGKNIIKQVELIEKSEMEHPGVDLRSIPSIDHLQSELRRIDLLSPPDVPEEIQRLSDFRWLREAPGSYHLGLSDGAIMAIRETALGDFEVFRYMKGIGNRVSVCRSLSEALRNAEGFIPPQDRRWMGSEARWREKEPSEAQIRLLFVLDRELKKTFRTPKDFLDYAISRNYTRGQISDQIETKRHKRN